MKKITFWVEGSSLEPYEVRFIKRSEKNLSAYCTCVAGENGQYCKHRFRILNGNKSGIISDNAEQVAEVNQWLKGSDIEAAILHMIDIEDEVEIAKTKLKQAKKAVVKAMLD